MEIGLEVTEITSQRFRRGVAHIPPGMLYDLSQFSTMALPRGGWAGNANADEWIDLLISSVLKKVKDYAQRAPFSKLELLAYSNTPGGCGLEEGDFDKTRISLLQVLKERDPYNRIDRVFQGVRVVYGSDLIMDVMKSPKVLDPSFQWRLRNKDILIFQLQAAFHR